MLGHLVDPYRLEGAGADIEGQRRPLNARHPKLLQDGSGEVQAGSRCGNRPRVPRVHGLIALPVDGLASISGIPADIGRQGHLPPAVEEYPGADVRRQLYPPPPVAGVFAHGDAGTFVQKL